MTLPEFIAHADWGTNPRKRQVASARRMSSGGYLVCSLAPADPTAVADGDLRTGFHVPVSGGQLLAGFDFPIGLPRAYAEVTGITFFPDLLPLLGIEPWDRFYDVAESADEISIHRPFYPFRPGGTSRDQLHRGLGLDRDQLRRRCEGNDAATMFWTLGGNQVGKAALSGWKYLATAPTGSFRLWPFAGDLTGLLDGEADVVAETYPREFYQRFRTGGGSKRQQEDRPNWIPGLLQWAELLGVEWEPEILQQVEVGFSGHSIGEDEFDAVVGLLGMIAVATGKMQSGEPEDDSAVKRVEGWILGRQSE